MSKKRKLSKMNNILNKIGIENLLSYFCIGFWSLYRNAIIVFMSIRNYVEPGVNLLTVAFQRTMNAQGCCIIFWLLL
jgi:hypothetical protein